MFLIAYNLEVYLEMLLDSVTYSVKTSVTMSVIYFLNAFSLNAYLCDIPSLWIKWLSRSLIGASILTYVLWNISRTSLGESSL